MKKDIKYILKRVAIGVLIALALMIIKGNFLLIVNARTSEDNLITYYTNPNEPVTNYNNNYYSNFCTGCDSVEVLDHFRPGLWYIIRDRYLDQENVFFNFDSYSYNSIFGENFSLRKGGTYNNREYFTSLDSFDFNFNRLSSSEYSPTCSTNFQLTKNNTYDILIEIEKDQYSTFYTNDSEMNLEDIQFVGYQKGNGTCNSSAMGVPGISLDVAEWITPNEIDGGNPNQAYIHIRFDTTSDMGDYTYSLGVIRFYGYGDNFHPFFFNTSDHNSIFKIKEFSFIKNGSLEITSSSSSPIGAIPGMDSTSSDDINVMESSFQQCEPLDIGCHLDNLLEGIKLIFYRIGQFFTGLINSIISLFTPNADNLKVKFNNIKDLLTLKLGFLTYPFELFDDINHRIVGIEPTTIITTPTITMPIWDTTLFSSTSFDFATIINDSRINPYYQIFFIVTNGLLVLGFIKFCYNRLNSILSGSDANVIG